jgi:hypothetical protein
MTGIAGSGEPDPHPVRNGIRNGRSAALSRQAKSTIPPMPITMLGSQAANQGATSLPLASDGPRYIGM